MPTYPTSTPRPIQRIARADHGFGIVTTLVAAGALLIVGLALVAALATVNRPAGHADASARFSAQTAIAQIEACNATRHDYRQCVVTPILSGTGLPLGTGPGHLAVSAPNATSYTILAVSAVPGLHGAHSAFGVDKDSAGMTRSCTQPGVNGCDGSGRW